jgi:hypothetical protein
VFRRAAIGKIQAPRVPLGQFHGPNGEFPSERGDDMPQVHLDGFKRILFQNAGRACCRVSVDNVLKHCDQRLGELFGLFPIGHHERKKVRTGRKIQQVLLETKKRPFYATESKLGLGAVARLDGFLVRAAAKANLEILGISILIKPSHASLLTVVGEFYCRKTRLDKRRKGCADMPQERCCAQFCARFITGAVQRTCVNLTQVLVLQKCRREDSNLHSLAGTSS